MNEQEVKIKIVLPWLREMGVRTEELALETTFSVRVGRRILPVNQTGDEHARGYLDILVRRGDRNLLVVEVKREGAKLTLNDRDQAISYARLLTPVAPYVWLTNGPDSRLYDTISTELIDPSAVDVGEGLEVSLPQSDRDEALRLFLTASPHNLLAFCQTQVRAEIDALSGEPGDVGARFIPKIQVHRPEVQSRLHNFLRSDSTTFVLVGDSGTGKTSALCEETLNLVDTGHPALFFSGGQLESTILEALAWEFEWAFGQLDPPPVLLRRLSGMSAGLPIILVVDAVDEWTSRSRVQHLSSLVRHLTPGEARLVLSCKSAAWPTFLRRLGTSTGIESHVYGANKAQAHSYELGPMSHSEFHEVVDLYRHEYGFAAPFETAALNEARRNPFLLRVMFEVATASGESFLSFDSVAFFKRYASLVADKTTDPRIAMSTLVAVAGILFDENKDAVGETLLRHTLGMTPNEPLMGDLFDHGVLVRQERDSGTLIGFQFSQFRDYLIAHESRNWHASSPSEFADEASTVAVEGVQNEALTSFYRIADTAHRRVLDEPARSTAREYVRQYCSVINRHFPTLKPLFSPYTDGDVGLVAEIVLNSGQFGMYGFRPIDSDDSEVLFTAVQAPFRSRLPELFGGTRLHHCSSVNNFRDTDIAREVLLNEVCPQLERMVSLGNLSEKNAPDLAAEKIIAIVEGNRRIFAKSLDSATGRARLPIRVDALMLEHRTAELETHFRFVREQQRRKQSNAHVLHTNRHIRLTDEDRAWARDAAAEAASSRISVRRKAINVDCGKLGEALGRASEALEPAILIDRRPLPLTSRLSSFGRWEPGEYELFKVHLKWLAERWLDSYERLVSSNFPTMKSRFELYSRMPVTVIVGCQRGEYKERTSLTMYLCKPRDQRDRNTVLLFEAGECRMEGWTLVGPNGRWELHSVSGMDVHDCIDGRRLAAEMDFSDGAVMRSWVYSTVREIGDVLAKLCRDYGVAVRSGDLNTC